MALPKATALAALALVLSLTGACGDDGRAAGGPPGAKVPKEDDPAPEADPLFVHPSSRDFSDNPRLLERIVSSAHGYFRFVNVRFSEAVCERFRDELPSMPAVNLHGDAHIEQYAVTSFGRGMTDFDDSSTGPGIIDLIRFGVSVRLACHERGWGECEDVFDELLRGYRDALADPALSPDPPAVAPRIQATFTRDRSEFLEWAQGLMRPLEDVRRGPLEEAFARYASSLVEETPDMDTDFFEIRALGQLHMGIGSALDEKYLIRVQGPTGEPGDDVVLEVKEIRDLSGISCIQNADSVDPFRILVGQSRIAYEPYPYLGYVTLDGRPFWIHGWADNYEELEVGTLISHAELGEIAYDVGVQLGRGHTKQIAAPLDHQLRRREREIVDEHERALRRNIGEFVERTEAAWRRFRDAAAEGEGQ